MGLGSQRKFKLKNDSDSGRPVNRNKRNNDGGGKLPKDERKRIKENRKQFQSE